MKWTVTTPATALPITAAAAQKHGQTLNEDEAGYVQSLIEAATDHAKDALDSSLMQETITATYYHEDFQHHGHRHLLGSFPYWSSGFWRGARLRVPRGPLIAISSITDADNKSLVVSTDYTIERYGLADEIKITASVRAPLVVVYTSGYATASAIPASIRHAINCHVATLYRNRESVADKAMVPVPHQLVDFYRMKRRSMGIG